MRRTIACLSTALLLVGCGSKTGLHIPEPDRDAGVDAGVDASLDADARPEPEECIELPFNDPPTTLPVTFVAQIVSADVYFLIDVTRSMSDEIDQIRDSLTSRIIPGLAAQIPDIRFSVGRFADFDLPSFGYGASGDEVFRLVLASTSNVAAVFEAWNGIQLQSGADTPESMVEALYLSASGEGLGSWVPPSRCPPGTVGYPCWRSTGSPIILVFTDAPSHNGPGGSNPYNPRAFDGPQPHTYEDAVNALRRVGARVLGLNSGDFGVTGRAHLEALARDTGALRPDGTPIVFDIGHRGTLLGDSVIEAVRTLVDEVPLDVDLIVEDWPFDDVDATQFVERVEAVSAMPRDGAIRHSDRFEAVRPGTRVNFRIVLRNDTIPQTDAAQRFYLKIILRSDGVTHLREFLLAIVVPPRGGGVVCPL